MLARLARREQRSVAAVGGFDQYLQLLQSVFTFNGHRFVVPSGKIEELTALEGAGNSIASACIAVRVMVFAEARFQFQEMRNGRPSSLFGTPDLALLERPWDSATTGDLLSRMELDGSLYGNSYWVVEGGQLLRLDPCKTIVATEAVGGQRPWSSRVVAYAVVDDANQEVRMWLPSEVAHYRPVPDPSAQFRGRSWMSTVVGDIAADKEMTTYKSAILANSGTPNMAVSLDPQISPEQFEAFVRSMEQGHAGAANAGKTLYLGGGADVTVVGADMQQADIKNIQGAGETRIAAAAGVPAVILGISEGLAGSSLNSGNYISARRRFADGTLRPLWRAAAGALSTLVPAPGGARLWYDDRDIPFLQEDVADDANIRSLHAQTIKALLDAGYDPDSAVTAVTTGDFDRLIGKHSGLYSVQLQPPGSMEPAEDSPADESEDEAEDGTDGADAEDTPARMAVRALELVAAREPAENHVHMPEIRLDPQVYVPEQPAPIVNVETAPVQVNVPPTPVVVNNELPRRRTVRTVERDEQNRIVRIIDEEFDELDEVM